MLGILELFIIAALTPAASSWTPDMLWQAWPRERFEAIAAPCWRPADLQRGLRRLKDQHADLRLEEAGRSAHGRPIHLLTLGHGPRKVLLWSQMHGDEPSATPALLDIADFLLRRGEEGDARAILDELTLLIVPMLNPDGAEIYSRRNAQGIDINRDALNLATPEGRILKRLRDKHEPMLGFNLHDQNFRTVVGGTGVLATNSVLAVAGDEQGTVTPGRLRAMRACSAMVRALAPFMPGGMGRYDEDWSPRAFGDNLTAWGTPVVLLESGGLPAGREMTDLTRLNFVALLTVLRDLAVNDLADHDRRLYDELPRNRSGAWVDVAVRGGSVLQPGTTSPYRADMAFNIEYSDQQRAGCNAANVPAVHRSRIVEIGDLRYLASGRDVEADGHLVLAPWVVGAQGWSARDWLDLEHLEELTRLGVGTVLWAVPAERHEAATALAGKLMVLGRARLRVTVGMADLPPFTLEGPPQRPASDSLDDVLGALAGDGWRELRAGRSLLQALSLVWPEKTGAAGNDPVFDSGASASFLLVSASALAGGEMEGARLAAVWLDGLETDGVATERHAISK